MRKIFGLAFLVCVALAAHAKDSLHLTEGLPEFKCRDEIETALRLQGAVGFWTMQAVVEEGTPYRTPTLNFGTWIELIIRADSTPVLYTVQNAKTMRFEFDASCVAKSSTAAGMDFSKRTTLHAMNDQELEKYIQQHKSGLIYVWSPEMIYSVKSFQNFKKTAEQLGLDFLSLVDPRTSDAFATKISEMNGVPRGQARMNSVELYMRNMTVHYPMSIVYKNGRLLDPVIIGAMNPDTLANRIRMVTGGAK